MPANRFGATLVVALLPLLYACAEPARTSGTAASAPVVQQEGNLFGDPGFETAGADFAPWTLHLHADPESFEFKLDDEVAKEGERSLRITRRRDEPYASITQRFPQSSFPSSRKMRLSAWVRGEGVMSPARLYAGFFAFGGNAGEADSGAVVQGTFDWTRLSIEFELPRRVDALEAGVTVTGDGTVWIDGLELVPLPD